MPLPEHETFKNMLPNSAHRLSRALEDAGFEAFFVGGFIRDAILDRPSNDIDIATDACWQTVRDISKKAGFSVHETGIKHGTVTVFDPVCKDSFEVTTYRTDGEYTDGRHPASIEFVSNIEEDLARRDFTMNAIAWSESKGIVDPYGGIEDIDKGIICAVGKPEKRFSEDGLRILRACRFASQLGFKIEKQTFAGMVTHKFMLANISVERIAHELDGFLLGDYVCRALLDTVDVIEFVLPELTAMKGCEQRTKYHIYDVLEHTAHVLENTASTRTLRWAALCHDMGKPASAFYDKDGTEHFYGHGAISVQLANSLLKRLKLPQTLINDVLMLVRHHDDIMEATNRCVQRMLVKLNGDTELFRNLTKLKYADAAAQAPICSSRKELAKELEEILDNIISDKSAFKITDLAINGNDLIAQGVPRGPMIGCILAELLTKVIEGTLINKHDVLLEYVQNNMGQDISAK